MNQPSSLLPEEILSSPAGPVPPPEQPLAPPPQSSFVISFVSPKKRWFFPAILVIVFLLLSLPLTMILVRGRTTSNIKAAEEELLGPRENFFIRDGIPEDPQAAKGKMLEAARANPTVLKGYLDNFEIPQTADNEENSRRLESFLDESTFSCEDVPEENNLVMVNERGNLATRLLAADDLRRFRERTGTPLRRCRFPRGRPISPPCGNPIEPIPSPTPTSPPCSCLCDKVIADKDLGNLKIGDVVNFAGFGKTSCLPRSDENPAIAKIKFIISKGGTAVQALEVPAVFDRQEGGFWFYKASYSYAIESAGNYTAAIQVGCPGGWED